MFEKLIDHLNNSIIYRLIFSVFLVSIPMGIAITWEDAAYLSTYAHTNFLSVMLSILIAGLTTPFLFGAPIIIVLERWAKSKNPTFTRRWVLIRLSFWALASLPTGIGLWITFRLILFTEPPLLEATNFVIATMVGLLIGCVYLLLEETIKVIQKREATLKAQIRELTIEIDEVKKQRDVEEIVGNDFFQNLQSKATEMRRQRNEREKRGDVAALDSPSNVT